LVFLRTFGRDKRTQQLVDALTRRWRSLGPVHLIGAPDSAYATLRPLDFYEFITGQLARRFIASNDDLRRMYEPHAIRDPDGLYRIETYYCFSKGWQGAVARLIEASPAVLMDLRAFGRQHRGCLDELEILRRHAARVQAVLLIDEHTDLGLLETILASARGSMESPADADSSTIRMVTAERSTAKTAAKIFQALLGLGPASSGDHR
jgi:hypothetical protein